MRKPTVIWEVIVLITDFITITRQSIAGITFHDDLGFDDRYRNIHECDPFYWHPLHLPEHCAEMFANAISSRVTAAAREPVRILTRKRKERWPTNSQEDIYALRHYYKYFEPEYQQPVYEADYMYSNDNDYSMERYEQEEPTYTLPQYSPYEKMLELLRQDISNHPIAPVIGMSNYGPVAMYQQHISRRSKNIINKISRAYADAHKVSNSGDDGYYYGKIEVPSDGITSNNQVTDDGNIINNTENSNIKRTNKKKKIKKKAKKQKQGKGLAIQ